MAEMSILIVALLGFAGGFLLSRNKKTIPAVRTEAESVREREVAGAHAKHREALADIEADRRNDGDDVADRLNNLARRKEIRK